LTPILLAGVEAGDRPDRQIVHALEPPLVIQPRQGAAWCELTPANSQVALKGNKPRSRPSSYNCFEVGLIGLGRSPAILPADSPIHAPAAVTGAFFPKQIFKGGPKLRSQWFDPEFHKTDLFLSYLCDPRCLLGGDTRCRAFGIARPAEIPHILLSRPGCRCAARRLSRQLDARQV